MKKRICVWLSALLLTALLAGCGEPSGEREESGSAGDQTTASVTASAPASEKKGYLFRFDGKDVYCNQDGEEALSILGEFEHKLESPSCAFDGVDTTYYYASVQLITYTDGSSPSKVLSIYLQDDTVETAEGISVGDSKEDVEAAYGEPAERGENSLIFEKDGMRLTFVFNEDGVSSVLYSLITEE